MLFKKISEAIKPHLLKMHNHPFNIGLHRGTLPRSTFRNFLEQDRLYLKDYSNALKRIAIRLNNKQHQKLFHQLSEDTFKTHITLYPKYLPKSYPPSFFHCAQLPTTKILAVSNYTDYLLNVAKSAPIEIAVASLVPCFYLYSEVGLKLRSTVRPNNPYKNWLESYSDASNLLSTQLAMNTLQELAFESSSIEQKNMISAFVKSTEFELAIWDSIYWGEFEIELEKIEVLSQIHALPLP